MNLSPLVQEEDVRAVAKQMRSFWIGRGKRVHELEEAMKSWVGAKYAAALGSGTCALVVALRAFPEALVSYSPVCEALDIAVEFAGKLPGVGVRISIYPDETGDIVDYARHLPPKGATTLKARFGVFSFGALKDVSGGIGGCVVSNEPVNAAFYKKLSPMSDINAAMILSQLERYKGKSVRVVAEGKTWSLG